MKLLNNVNNVKVVYALSNTKRFVLSDSKVLHSSLSF